MLSQKRSHFVRVPIDHWSMHCDEPTARALFDDLQIVPVWARLLLCRRSASPSLVRDAAPGFHHRLSIAAFPIRGHRWRLLRVSTCSELRH
jgi:hypothetical protein